MQRSNALRELLEDLTLVFHDQYVDVEFTSGPSSASPGDATREPFVNICTNLRGEYGVRDVSDAQELRIMVDHLSHELEHLRQSDLMGKQEFVEHYQEAAPYYANLAGYVINVLEDVYIDAQRIKRFPGLRATHAYYVDTQVSSADHVGASLPLTRRLTSGLWEVAHAGTARGIDKAEPEVREALAKLRVIAQKVRDADDYEDRVALSHAAMDVMLDVLPDVPTPDEQDGIERGIERAPTNDLPEGAVAEPAPEAPDDAESEEASEDEEGSDDESGAGDDTAGDDGDAGSQGGDGTGDDAGDGDGKGRALADLLGDVPPERARVVND